MRGKKQIPNDMTHDKVRELTGQGSTQPMVAAVLGMEAKCPTTLDAAFLDQHTWIEPSGSIVLNAILKKLLILTTTSVS